MVWHVSYNRTENLELENSHHRMVWWSPKQDGEVCRWLTWWSICQTLSTRLHEVTCTGPLLAGRVAVALGRYGERSKDAGNGRVSWATPHADRGLGKKAKGVVFMRRLRTVWTQAKLLWGSPTKHEICCFSHLCGAQHCSYISWDGDSRCSKRWCLPLTQNNILPGYH